MAQVWLVVDGLLRHHNGGARGGHAQACGRASPAGHAVADTRRSSELPMDPPAADPPRRHQPVAVRWLRRIRSPPSGSDRHRRLSAEGLGSTTVVRWRRVPGAVVAPTVAVVGCWPVVGSVPVVESVAVLRFSVRVDRHGAKDTRPAG